MEKRYDLIEALRRTPQDTRIVNHNCLVVDYRNNKDNVTFLMKKVTTGKYFVFRIREDKIEYQYVLWGDSIDDAIYAEPLIVTPNEFVGLVRRLRPTQRRLIWLGLDGELTPEEISQEWERAMAKRPDWTWNFQGK